MGYKRVLQPPPRPDDATLTASMIGIGMAFSGRGDRDANIEDTVLWASELGMEGHDLRVLSVLTTWFEVHHAYLNADRLVRIVEEHASPRVRAFWSAMAQHVPRDRRFSRWLPFTPPRRDLLPTGTDFQLARHGEDPRFEGTALRVPHGTLRDRQADVLPPEVLARRHPGYHNRVLMGPTWRADVWTVLQRHPDITTSEVARRSYASFATAWSVRQDFLRLHPPSTAPLV